MSAAAHRDNVRLNSDGDVEEEEEEEIKKTASEEFLKMQEAQRVQRLRELLKKTEVFSTFLAKKLAQAKQETSQGQSEQKKRKNTESSPDKKKQKTLADCDPSFQDSKLGSAEQIIDNVTTVKNESSPTSTSTTVSSTITPTDEVEAQILNRQPKLLTGGILREYQLQGFEWLVSLYENGLNGILADEMGLGKTIQCISFLAYLKEKKVLGPFLVVAPVITLVNWVAEFEKFAPSIPVILYHGSVEERAKIRTKRMAKINERSPVVISSYEIVMNDRQYLSRYTWKYLVVDEGQRIKNLNCRLIKDLRSFKADNRLILTGTPLQNNLTELWSLLNFILPKIFDDVEAFQSWFDFDDVLSSEGSQLFKEEPKLQIVTTLHQILKPFLLRRLKCDVEKDLPKKREYLVYAPLTEKQRIYYDKILQNSLRQFLMANDGAEKQPEPEQELLLLDIGIETTEERVKKGLRNRNRKGRKDSTNYRELSDFEYFKKMEEASEEENAGSSPPADSPQNEKRDGKEFQSLRLQNMVMQLRKICNHPDLFKVSQDDDEINEEIVTSSGKLLLLDRLLPELIKRGHKVLIFSQMTSMLDILQDYLNLRGHNYCRIDGGVPHQERQTQITEFNTKDDVRFFLLSTRAGGLGINLTAADTCIIFDSDWNPQVDLQAQDRVHRIGQKRPVIVYRLCTANSFESKMLEKTNAKRKLEKLVIHKGRFKKVDSENSGVQFAELAEILKSEDGEKIDFSNPNNIISNEDLERILDRSDQAFQTKVEGKGFTVFDAQQSDAFATFEQQDS